MSRSPASVLQPYCHWGQVAFSNLTPEALADLDAISVRVEYRDGATLMRQGDLPHFVRIMCDGRVKISTASHDGKSLLPKIAGAGTILGLVSAGGQIKYETTLEILHQEKMKDIAI